ncbi:MAG: 4Fe-4S binding protein, partial [Bacteroidales bacterium]|nr:4Fe-4S binding protein [Bacteroidales bacterium]
MLKKIRVALASVFLLGLTWLFLDFTGTAQLWFGWMAKLQFLPAVLAV